MSIFNLAIERQEQDDNVITGFEKPSGKRSRHVKISNVPTENGKYIYLGILKSAYSPRYMQEIVKSKGSKLAPLVLQVYTETCLGGDNRLTTIYDPDPEQALKKPEGLWIQHVMFVDPQHIVLRQDKDNMVEAATAYYGHHSDNKIYFNLEFGQPILIYAGSEPVVRYSEKGFAYRRCGKGGRLWFGTHDGYLINHQMKDRCMAEMSGR